MGVLFIVTLLFGVSLAVKAPCIELNDGNKMPVVALGTGRGTASESAPVDEVRHAVYWAIEAGYRHIDTAAIYFDEPQVGQAIAEAIANKLVTREELFITTKLWNDKHRKEQVVPALKESLKNLGLEYVDLYLIHFPVAEKLAVKAPCIELNDGNKMPVVALGTGRGTASESAPVDEVRHAVYWAIEAGYRHIDTAAIYFDEPQVGQAIAEAIANKLVTREELFITTKLWNDKHRKEQVVPALKESLKNLGLEYVDLYLIHFPVAEKADGSPDDVDYLETWKGMEEAKELGLAKSIGVSNFNSSQIDRLVANCKHWPVVNEFEVNPTLTQEPLVKHCQNLGIAVMAYSPFGFLVSRNTPNAPPPRIDDPLLLEMANKYKKTTSQIVLRYLIERGLTPIPKSTNKKRIAQNIDLFDFNLTEAEVNSISNFNRNIRVIEIDSWKDYPNYPFWEP